MAGYGFKEARINRERHARVNHCGDCGIEINLTDLLCDDCKAAPTPALTVSDEFEYEVLNG